MKLNLYINDDHIMDVKITRYRGADGGRCTYIVESDYIGMDGELRSDTFGGLMHDYKDGAKVLAKKALERIIERETRG